MQYAIYKLLFRCFGLFSFFLFQISNNKYLLTLEFYRFSEKKKPQNVAPPVGFIILFSQIYCNGPHVLAGTACI